MTAVLEATQLKTLKSQVLYGISWEIYESLVEQYWGENSPRLTYDSGMLKIEMPNSDKHEEASFILEVLFAEIAVEMGIAFRCFRSMTFKRKNIRKGFEPDSCFYTQSLEKIKGKSNIGIENEVPPDLTIEVNRTSSSVARMPIFAAFGVREVWRFNGKEVKFYGLKKGVYLEIEKSLALPILTSEKATAFLHESREMNSTAWAKKIREWVNDQIKLYEESIDE